VPIQKDDRTTTWVLDQNDKRWILERDVRIDVDGQHGIVESASGSEIILKGDVRVEGADYDAVRFMSSSSSLFIGDDAVIDARNGRFGVLAEGAGQPVENHGRILGYLGGVNFSLWGTFKNEGEVYSYRGVVFNDGGAPSQVANTGTIEALLSGVTFADNAESRLVNSRDGVIDGGDNGVILGADSYTEIINHGTIIGTTAIFGVTGPGGSLDLVNTGKIIGDIQLGDGPNVIDSFDGRIDGDLYGGASDDIYKISQSKLTIYEMVNYGLDEVRSTASYRLSSDIENLTLVGRKDINGTGNAAANDLRGNAGDNRISGLEGNDELRALKGNDVLTGGAGTDTFYFSRNDGRDVITDFEAGVDRISLPSVRDEDDFEQLNIRQAGDDVVIDLAGRNQLLLRDIDMDDLNYEDFAVT
jgi:Ca2+-binding RTX toxin-like protein